MAELVSKVVEQVFMPLTVGGGIRTLDDLIAAVKAGATRIGTSSTESILKEARERGLPEA